MTITTDYTIRLYVDTKGMRYLTGYNPDNGKPRLTLEQDNAKGYPSPAAAEIASKRLADLGYRFSIAPRHRHMTPEEQSKLCFESPCGRYTHHDIEGYIYAIVLGGEVVALATNQDIANRYQEEYRGSIIEQALSTSDLAAKSVAAFRKTRSQQYD